MSDYLLIQYDSANKCEYFYLTNSIQNACIDNKTYIPNEEQSHFCFYDLLRTETNDMAGIRICPFSDYTFPYHLVEGYSNTIIIEEYDSIEIFFDLSVFHYNPEISDDQFFGDSVIMYSSGEIVLAFELRWAEDSEKNKLMQKMPQI